jgi:hypothetical protein
MAHLIEAGRQIVTHGGLAESKGTEAQAVSVCIRVNGLRCGGHVS